MRATIPAAGSNGATVTVQLPSAHRGFSKITRVQYRPASQVIGAATNHRRWRLYNRGPVPPGTGSKVIAELLLNATTVVAGAEEARDLPLLFASLTGTNIAEHVIREGDVLEFESAPIGAGMPDPGGTVLVDTQEV